MTQGFPLEFSYPDGPHFTAQEAWVSTLPFIVNLYVLC